MDETVKKGLISMAIVAIVGLLVIFVAIAVLA